MWADGGVGSEAEGREVLGSGARSPKGPRVNRHTETALPHHFLCRRRSKGAVDAGRRPEMCGRRHLSDHRRRNAVKAGAGFSAVWLYVLQEQNAKSYMQADTRGVAASVKTTEMLTPLSL